MPSPWVSFQRAMDDVVDETWAEPVEFHPWTKGGYTGGDAPDTTRQVLKGPNVVGVYMTPGSAATGEVADGASIRIGMEDIWWVSIQQDILGDPANWREADRVYFPERDEWFEIRHVSPSATRRPNVYLSRLQEVDEG